MSKDNELNVKIGADNSDLKQALDDSTKSIKKFGDETNKSGENTKGLSDSLGKIKTSTKDAMGALDKASGSLAGVSGNFKSTYTAVKGATAGLSEFKVALATTGIGLAVIALGLLVENWDSVENAMSATYSELKKINDELKRLGDNLDILDSEISLIREQIKLQKNLGNNTDDLIKKEKELLAVKLQKLVTQRTLYANQIEVLKLRVTELTITQKLANLIALAQGYPPVYIINEDAAGKIKDATINLNKTDKEIVKISGTVAKLNGGFVETTKKVKALKQAVTATFGSQNWAKQTISFLQDLQANTKVGTDAWLGYQKAIENVKRTLGELSGREIQVPIPTQQKGYTKLAGNPGANNDNKQIVDDTKSTLSDISQLMVDFDRDTKTLITGSITNTFSQLGEAIGTALATGGDVFSAIGQTILVGIGNFLKDLGKLLIQYGVAAVAYSTASKALTNPLTAAPAGLALIAAGVVLTAVGSAIGTMARGGASSSYGSSNVSGSGSEYSPGVQSRSYGTSRSGGGNVIFEIAGTKLIGVIKNTLDRNRSFGGNLTFG